MAFEQQGCLGSHASRRSDWTNCCCNEGLWRRPAHGTFGCRALWISGSGVPRSVGIDSRCSPCHCQRCTSLCHTLRCAGGANEAHEVSTKAEDNLMLAAFWLRFPTRRSRPQKPDVRGNRCCSNPFSKKDLQKLVTSAVEKRLVKFEKTKPDDDASVKSDSLADTPVGSSNRMNLALTKKNPCSRKWLNISMVVTISDVTICEQTTDLDPHAD